MTIDSIKFHSLGDGFFASQLHQSLPCRKNDPCFAPVRFDATAFIVNLPLQEWLYCNFIAQYCHCKSGSHCQLATARVAFFVQPATARVALNVHLFLISKEFGSCKKHHFHQNHQQIAFLCQGTCLVVDDVILPDLGMLMA